MLMHRFALTSNQQEGSGVAGWRGRGQAGGSQSGPPLPNSNIGPENSINVGKRRLVNVDALRSSAARRLVFKRLSKSARTRSGFATVADASELL